MEELFLKIALCDTDKKFEQIIDKYLVHIIESLESNQQKALEIITHVKKRVVSLTDVQLPVMALFQLFAANKSATINMFSTVFLKLGIPRVPLDSLNNILVQCLLQGQRDPIYLSLWSLNMAKYIQLQSPKKDETISRVDAFITLLKSTIGDEARYQTVVNNMCEHVQAVLTIDIHPLSCICPQQAARLKTARTNQFTKLPEVTAEQIKTEKAAVSTFIIHWTYITNENCLPADKSVFFLTLLSYLQNDNAESALRCLDYSLEDADVVRSIYKLYLGEMSAVSNLSLKHAMAPERLRIKLTKMLIKSKLAAKTFPASLQITFDLLRDDWKKLARSAAFDWLNHLRAQSQISPKVVPLLLDRILKVLADDDPDDRLFNLIPALIDLNESAFNSKILTLFDILMTSLNTSPGATTPLVALVRNCAKRNIETAVLLERLQMALQNVPSNDKWFTISCLRAVNILAPFNSSVGADRMCILNAVCQSALSHEIRQEALSLLGMIHISAIFQFLQQQPDGFTPTVQLVRLIKWGIINTTISKYHNPTEGDSTTWYKSAISVFKSQSQANISSLQSVLLNFDMLGRTTDSSELILSQTELLDSTVRAGFPLENNNFFVANKSNSHARAEKLSHLMQGHTFGINRAAASLLASQMVAKSFEEFEPLFESNHDQSQESAYQIAIAMYCGRVDNDTSMMAAVTLIQSLIDSAAWETHSTVILERILTSLGQVSARVEIDSDLIGRVGKCLKHENDKVKIAAITTIAHFAGSSFQQSPESTTKLLEVILCVEKVETTPMQIAMGTAVVSIATGQSPRDKFSEQCANRELRDEVIDAVISRTFAPEKGKTKGTGIWLASLIDVGRQNDISNEKKFEFFCGLISRLFIAPHESVYCAKALRIIFDNSDEEMRKKYQTLVQNIIKHNKTPDRSGKLGEKSISLKEAAGFKELIKAIQKCELDEQTFNLLALGISGSLRAVSDISQKTIDMLLPELLLMVNHKQEAIRTVGKNMYTAFDGNRRIMHVLNRALATVIDKLQGFDGDFRESAARTLPQLLSHINESNSDVIDYIDLWNSVLRCCDDTRENVRVVASGTCMDLLRTTIRIVNEAREVPKWVNQLLEIIITQYIESTSTPSVIVGMTLLNHWGDSQRGLPLLFPFASRLIPTLIQKCTITEQANVAKGATRNRDYGELEKETLDKMKNGDFLRVCIKIIDSDNLPIHTLNNIAPQVGTLIKQGVGVNARGMAMYIASRIGVKWKQRASECAGKLLAPCLPLLGSSSDALRSEASSAIPCLVGAASQKTKTNFASRIEKLYFEMREDDTENRIGHALDGAVAKFDSDLAPFIGPICWLGKQDKTQQRFFDSAWDKGEFNIRQIGEEIVRYNIH